MSKELIDIAELLQEAAKNLETKEETVEDHRGDIKTITLYRNPASYLWEVKKETALKAGVIQMLEPYIEKYAP